MENIPSYQKRDKGKCIHCHSIHPAFYEESVAAEKWKPELKWVYPDPARIGMELDRDQQRLMTRVDKNSIADKAGLQRGDQILRLNGVAIASVADLMFALDGLPATGGATKVEILRRKTPATLTLKLPDGWKTGTPLSFSWRPFKWGLTPAPGFGGPQLTPAELQQHGLDSATNATGTPFAFRVQYLVTWNENRRFGQAAAQAGLRKGDIAGKTDFQSVEHFHSWWRLTRTVGETVKIEILRGGKRKVLKLKVIR